MVHMVEEIVCMSTCKKTGENRAVRLPACGSLQYMTAKLIIILLCMHIPSEQSP